MSKTPPLSFSAAPPQRASASAADIESFANGADVHHAGHAAGHSRKRPKLAPPGELDFLALPDTRRVNGFNLRMTDRERGTLKYLDEHMKESMHEFCMQLVRDGLSAKLKELTGRELGEREA